MFLALAENPPQSDQVAASDDRVVETKVGVFCVHFGYHIVNIADLTHLPVIAWNPRSIRLPESFKEAQESVHAHSAAIAAQACGRTKAVVVGFSGLDLDRILLLGTYHRPPGDQNSCLMSDGSRGQHPTNKSL